MKFLSSLMLFLMINTINATLDISQFMPDIFGMVPINGQIKINDQVFNIGPNSTSTTPKPLSDENLFTSQLPAFDSQNPNFESRNPSFNSQNPNFESRNSNFDSQNPNFGSRNPSFNSQNPNFESRNPSFNSQNPNFESRNSNFDSQNPNFGSRNPSFNSQNPNFESQNPNFESQIPNFESRIPNFETRIPNFESRIPNFDSQTPNFDSSPNLGSAPPQPSPPTFASFNTLVDQNSRLSSPIPAMDTMPFGFPERDINDVNESPLPVGSSQSMRARSNINPSEMSLMVSPDSITRTVDSMSSSPLLMPSLAQSNQRSEQFQPLPIALSNPVNNRSEQSLEQILAQRSPLPDIPSPTTQINGNQRSENMPFEPLPVVISGERKEVLEVMPEKSEQNIEGSPDSLQVTHETSFVFPPATVNQIPVDTHIEEPTVRSTLEQHLPPVIAQQQVFNQTSSKPRERFENSVIPIRFMSSLFRPQRIPTLEELDKVMAQRSGSLTPQKTN